MGTVRVEMKEGMKPAPEQIAEIRAAAARPHVYDEECPPFSKEELKQFRRVKEIRKEDNASNRKQTVTLRLKPQTLERAKSLGKGYTSILSQVIENVLSDPGKLKSLMNN